MPDLFHFNDEMRTYLHTLPYEIQQQITQSNASLGSLSDLKAAVQQLLHSSGR